MRIEIELGKDLPPDEYAVESVEHEGTGHLDTICDLVGEDSASRSANTTWNTTN
jgi:S-adenosylmethionine synthetase